MTIDTGLPFRAWEHFGQEEQAERQELYIRIAEWVWNPSRLDRDGVKPLMPGPLAPRVQAVVEVEVLGVSFSDCSPFSRFGTLANVVLVVCKTPNP